MHIDGEEREQSKWRDLVTIIRISMFLINSLVYK